MSNSLTTVATPYSFELTQIFNNEEFRDAAGGFWTKGRTGNRWGLTLNYRNLTGPQRRAMWAWAGLMRGSTNGVYVELRDNLNYSPAGTGGGTPVVDGAVSAGAVEIPVRGAVDGPTYLAAGDFLDIRNELKLVVEDVVITAGTGTIKIWPEAHNDITDGRAIDIDNPFFMGYMIQSPVMTGTVHPQDDSGTPWLSPDFVIQFEESVYII